MAEYKNRFVLFNQYSGSLLAAFRVAGVVIGEESGFYRFGPAAELR
jgi:hypothetical protein